MRAFVIARASRKVEARSCVANFKQVVPVVEHLGSNFLPLAKSHPSVRFVFGQLEAGESGISATIFVIVQTHDIF